MHDHTQTQILSPEDSAFWRQAYLEAFVDTTGDHYRRYIASPRQYSDGAHYEGYIWDCLRSPSRITIDRFRHEVVRHPEVFVIADDHSRDRISGAPLWPYSPNSVARFEPQRLLASLDSLPEDIYVFDSSVSWTLVLTHEDDGNAVDPYFWPSLLIFGCRSLIWAVQEPDGLPTGTFLQVQRHLLA